MGLSKVSDMSTKEIDIDHIVKSWLLSITEDGTNMANRFIKNNRPEYLEKLFESFVKYGVDYDDAKMQKRKVLEILVSEEGHKNANKKNHKRGTWLPNAKRDFDAILTKFYTPNAGLEVKNVIFKESAFKLPRNESLVEWVKENYGTSENIIEDAHNINSTICLEYFTQLEKRIKNEQATND